MVIENIVDEWCSDCCSEVQIKATFDEKQFCPNCGKPIKPCALCDWDSVTCNECPLGCWAEGYGNSVKLVSPIPTYFAKQIRTLL